MRHAFCLQWGGDKCDGSAGFAFLELVPGLHAVEASFPSPHGLARLQAVTHTLDTLGPVSLPPSSSCCPFPTDDRFGLLAAALVLSSILGLL